MPKIPKYPNYYCYYFKYPNKYLFVKNDAGGNLTIPKFGGAP